MDPNLFHLDWDRATEVMATIVILAIFIERALSLIFEHKKVVPSIEKQGWKTPIAFIVSLIVCIVWKFDALSMIVLSDTTRPVGYVISAAVIAGGSKGSVKLFRDILGWKSKAYKEYAEKHRSGTEEGKPKDGH